MKVYKTDPKAEFPTEERCNITEVMNDPEHREMSIAQARVLPGVRTQLHSLSDTSEVYYILEGEGRLTVDGASFLMPSGDSFLIKAGQSQTIENTGAIDLIFLCICRPAFEPSVYVNLEK